MRTLKEGTFDHEYYYEGTRLVMETVDGVKLIYLYDESGNVEAIRYNNASYYLIRNILGDVVQLRNAQNELIANYSYNAYGLPLSITNASGTEITNEAHIALINPIRYRGYYYDNETGLYYLESRYYDPELCRFISADALLITSPIGMNLYAYCNNDPVNFVDPHGFCTSNKNHGPNIGFCECCEDGIEPDCGCSFIICPCVNGWPEEEEEEEQSGATVQKTTSTTRVALKYTGSSNARVSTSKGSVKIPNVVTKAQQMRRNASQDSPLRNATGSYEIIYSNGYNYIGKGGFQRAINSAKRNSDLYGVEVISFEWRASPNERMAFVDEYLRQKSFMGDAISFKGLPTYNRIWSPGRKYYGN